MSTFGADHVHCKTICCSHVAPLKSDHAASPREFSEGMMCPTIPVNTREVASLYELHEPQNLYQVLMYAGETKCDVSCRNERVRRQTDDVRQKKAFTCGERDKGSKN